MPTYNVHMAIAKKVNDRINMDQDSILLGSIMPDICAEKRHNVSHYQNGLPGIEGLADADKFVKKHKKQLKNPIMMGYLIHLLTDRFYNAFAYNNYYIFDENGKEIGLHLKSGDKYLPASVIKDCKHTDFYLYDRWLLTHGYVPKFNGFECLDNVIDIDVATFNKDMLKQIIIDSNKELDNLSLLSKIPKPGNKYIFTNKKELDHQFNLCCSYILDYIKSINLK